MIARGISPLVAILVVTATNPGHAGAVEVPRRVNVSDPVGDANYLNTQDLHYLSGGTIPDRGDITAPAGMNGAADVLAVWFSHDGESITAHIHTRERPRDDGIVYYVFTNPTVEGHIGCLQFVFRVPGAFQSFSAYAYLYNLCAGGETRAKYRITELEDGTGILSIIVPRAAHRFFADGGVLTRPHADVRHTVVADLPKRRTVNVPVIDDTRIGRDYKID